MYRKYLIYIWIYAGDRDIFGYQCFTYFRIRGYSMTYPVGKMAVTVKRWIVLCFNCYLNLWNIKYELVQFQSKYIEWTDNYSFSLGKIVYIIYYKNNDTPRRYDRRSHISLGEIRSSYVRPSVCSLCYLPHKEANCCQNWSTCNINTIDETAWNLEDINDMLLPIAGLNISILLDTDDRNILYLFFKIF